MKTVLQALVAVLIGSAFIGSTYAAEGSKTGAPAGTHVAGGEMKKDESQKDAKASKKQHRKKQHEEKK